MGPALTPLRVPYRLPHPDRPILAAEGPPVDDLYVPPLDVPPNLPEPFVRQVERDLLHIVYRDGGGHPGWAIPDEVEQVCEGFANRWEEACAEGGKLEDLLSRLWLQPAEPTWNGLPHDPRDDLRDLAAHLLGMDGGGGGGGGAGSGGSGQGSDAEGEGGEGEEDGAAPLGTGEDAPGDPKDTERRETLAKLLPDLRHLGSSSLDATLDEAQLRKLADDLDRDPHLRRMLDLIGRVSSAAWMPAKRQPSGAREDVRDLEQGADLSRLIPIEYARFATPLAPFAYVDFVERRLLQLRVDGSEPKGRGPIVAAIDLSGSMSMDVLNLSGMTKPIDVAKVLAVALVKIASVQRRGVHIIGFDTRVLWETGARKGTGNYLKVIEQIMGARVVGGTDFTAPVLRMLSQVRGDLREADLLMITDGDAHLADHAQAELRHERKRKGTRLFSLLIGPGAQGSVLTTLSDAAIPLRSFDDLEHIGREIAKR